MGYTHYWYRKQIIDKAIFELIKSDFQKLIPALSAAGVGLANGRGEGDPIITDQKLTFNGRGAESYETFAFPQVLTLAAWEQPNDGGYYFQFCKTAERPYDLAVMAFLIVAKYHMQHAIRVKSDGNVDDWAAARELCRDHLNMYGVELDFYR
ncbi:hypothetical protein BS614_31025 (plasmid) [Paenibacillus xylanexedens]|uniref:hypothetical protein n=1 Tax=Paenibacillus xylanexedens TaxID=528191 RepID=UPI0009387C5F|nr:hypothetical protein [Paenibacillus xylanexedens]APO48551.1 hypothetical protein BS614_31025 [Paenibacillus xylanexedens]